jgi:hypothetical protein
MKSYSYVGPPEIVAAISGLGGRAIYSSEALLQWVADAEQSREPDGLFWATYVVLEDGQLYIADRRHVACAVGQDVLAAGELAFVVDGEDLEVVEVSNQSTGYCPEPICGMAVIEALRRASIDFPKSLTVEITFRRCESCDERNVVRDCFFVCACCDADLPQDWDFA